MTGKLHALDSGTHIATLDELDAMVEEMYTAVTFQIPGTTTTVELAMLSEGEYRHVQRAANIGTDTFDASLWNRLLTVYGLVKPRVIEEPPAGKVFTRAEREQAAMRAAERIDRYTPATIRAIADRVYTLTNDYRTAREEEEPLPFLKRSGSVSSSPTDSTSSPPK